MNNIKKFAEFVNESSINEASYPKEATSLSKKVGGKVEPHFDLDDVYFISNDKDLNIMWSKESGYEVSDDDGKDLYHGDDMRKAEKAIKENNSTINEAGSYEIVNSDFNLELSNVKKDGTNITAKGVMTTKKANHAQFFLDNDLDSWNSAISHWAETAGIVKKGSEYSLGFDDSAKIKGNKITGKFIFYAA